LNKILNNRKFLNSTISEFIKKTRYAIHKLLLADGRTDGTILTVAFQVCESGYYD